jgi:hypothetical protein
MKKLSRVLVVAAMCAAVAPVAAAAQSRGQAPATSTSTGTATPYLPGIVEVINPWSEAPMLKYRMGHEHKQLLMVDYCYGDLYVTASRVQFNVGGPYAAHSFDLPREQVTGVKPWSVGLEIVVNRRKYHVLLYPLGKGEPQIVLLLPSIDTNYTSPQPLADALTNFPLALERARANLPKPAPPPPPPEPPKPPGVLILEPSAGGDAPAETNAETLTVRGVAMDDKGIALVRVGSKLAAMQPRSEMATEFWVEDYPLNLGENEIEVVVTNAEREEAKTSVKVRRVEAPPPEPPKPVGLTVEEVLKLLEAGVTPARVETIVKERGAGFDLTEENEKKLRDAGATDALLLAIAKSKK